MPTFDDKDAQIVARNVAAWNELVGPRVGDFVEMADGSMRRFTHDWGDWIQIDESSSGSFYFGFGYASYSGGLERGFNKKDLIDTGKTCSGRFWMFHHDLAYAHNGVTFEIDCRVYKYVPPEDLNEADAERADS